MKNIFDILKDFGLEVPSDKKVDFEKTVLENYKTVTDYDNQTLKLNQANDTIKANDDTIKDLKGKLDEFKDADVSGLKDRITQLETEKQTIKSTYEAQLSDRDFGNLVRECISAAKGRNAKAITALLDVDTLKKSKNQKEDIAEALKKLAEAEDSKMLFGESANPVGTGDPIGDVGGKKMTAEEKEDADCRAAMGLPPIKAEGGEK